MTNNIIRNIRVCKIRQILQSFLLTRNFCITYFVTKGADTERSGTGWDEVYYGEMENLQLSGKKVAVFGLGDQISYSENYADASGEVSSSISFTIILLSYND